MASQNSLLRKRSFSLSARKPVAMVTRGYALGADQRPLHVGDIVVYSGTRPEHNFIGAIVGWAPNTARGVWPGFVFTDDPRSRQPIARSVQNFRVANDQEIALWKSQNKNPFDYIEEVRPAHVARELAKQFLGG